MASPPPYLLTESSLAALVLYIYSPAVSDLLLTYH